MIEHVPMSSDDDVPAPSPSAAVLARRASREAKSMREESGSEEDSDEKAILLNAGLRCRLMKVSVMHTCCDRWAHPPYAGMSSSLDHDPPAAQSLRRYLHDVYPTGTFLSAPLDSVFKFTRTLECSDAGAAG